VTPWAMINMIRYAARKILIYGNSSGILSAFAE